MTAGPIDWRAVVDEAIWRRKQDGLSQRDFAALAGVSVPTLNSFEKGETSLRFDRVVAILDAVGLFVQPGPSGSLDGFIHSARQRWHELTGGLPDGDPALQPFGHSEQAYAFAQAGPELGLAELRDLLARAPATSGWPPFWVPSRAALRPIIRDRSVECWLGKPDVDRAFGDAAHSDFWQIGRGAEAYLQRGYQEDGPDLQPGAIFDVTLPIWRTAEVLIHASWLAAELGVGPTDEIRFFARYTGLAGRRLLSWAKPLLAFPLGPGDAPRARTDSVDLETITTREQIDHALEEVTGRLLQPLYERFDGFQAPAELVAGQIEELRRNLASDRHQGRAARRAKRKAS
jgi:transcriptional regulator with XRE-family HTH domain